MWPANQTNHRGSGRPEPPGVRLRLLELPGLGPERSGYSPFPHQGIRHPVAEIVTTALGKNLAAHRARRAAHAAGEIPEPEPKPRLVELRLHRSAQERLQFPHPVVLALRIPEVVGAALPRRHRLRGVDGEPLVQEELAGCT